MESPVPVWLVAGVVGGIVGGVLGPLLLVLLLPRKHCPECGEPLPRNLRPAGRCYPVEAARGTGGPLRRTLVRHGRNGRIVRWKATDIKRFVQKLPVQRQPRR